MIRNGEHDLAARGWGFPLSRLFRLSRLSWGDPYVCNLV